MNPAFSGSVTKENQNEGKPRGQLRRIRRGNRVRKKGEAAALKKSFERGIGGKRGKKKIEVTSAGEEKSP